MTYATVTTNNVTTNNVTTNIVKLPRQAAKASTSNKIIGCVYKLVYRTFTVNIIRRLDEDKIATYTVTSKSVTGTSIYKSYYCIQSAILAAKVQFERYGNPMAEGKPKQ